MRINDFHFKKSNELINNAYSDEEDKFQNDKNPFYINDSISQNSSDNEESKLISKKQTQKIPTRPKGDQEESKRESLIYDNSPQPHNNEDAIQTPSMTYEDISVNEEYLEHQAESDKGIHDKIIVGSIHILNTKDKKFMNKKIPSLSERVLSYDPETVGQAILTDLEKVSNQIRKIWRKVIKSIQIEPRYIIEDLRMDYDIRHYEKIGQSIFLSTIETDDFVSPIEENLFEIHQRLLKERESKNYHLETDNIIVQDQEFWKKPVNHPIFFEE